MSAYFRTCLATWMRDRPVASQCNWTILEVLRVCENITVQMLTTGNIVIKNWTVAFFRSTVQKFVSFHLSLRPSFCATTRLYFKGSNASDSNQSSIHTPLDSINWGILGLQETTTTSTIRDQLTTTVDFNEVAGVLEGDTHSEGLLREELCGKRAPIGR